MNINFPACVGFVLEREGGYVNDPRDPGGETNFGIARRSHPNEDIKGMTRERATAIYRREYWTAVHGDDLPAGADLAVFDMAVNAGRKTAVKLAQRVAGCAEDGVLGPLTLACIKSMDARAFVHRYCDARLDYYSRLKSWPVFGKGWSNRVEMCRSAAIGLLPLATKPVAASEGAPASVKPLAHVEIPERPGLLARIFTSMFG